MQVAFSFGATVAAGRRFVGSQSQMIAESDPSEFRTYEPTPWGGLNEWIVESAPAEFRAYEQAPWGRLYE